MKQTLLRLTLGILLGVFLGLIAAALTLPEDGLYKHFNHRGHRLASIKN